MGKKSARPRWQSIAGGRTPPKPPQPIVIQMSNYHCNTMLASLSNLNALREAEQALKGLREAAERKHYETVNMICQKDDIEVSEGSQVVPDFVKRTLTINPNLAADQPSTPPPSNGHSEDQVADADTEAEAELTPTQ